MKVPVSEAQRQYLQHIRTKMALVSARMREAVAKLHAEANAAANPEPYKQIIPPTMELAESAQRVARVAERGARKGTMSPAEWSIMFEEMQQSDQRVLEMSRRVAELTKGTS